MRGIVMTFGAKVRSSGLQHVMEATLKADQALVATGLDHRLVSHRLIVEIASARKAHVGRRT